MPESPAVYRVPSRPILEIYCPHCRKWVRARIDEAGESRCEECKDTVTETDMAIQDSSTEWGVVGAWEMAEAEKVMARLALAWTSFKASDEEPSRKLGELAGALYDAEVDIVQLYSP